MQKTSRLRARLIAQFLTLVFVGSTTIRAATIVVTNTADSGAGSLRAALARSTTGDTIDVTGVSGTITLTNGALVVTNDLVINGPGSALLTINGNNPSTTDRVLLIMNGSTVSISGLALSNGNAGFSGGGGVFNYGSTLTLSNCAVSGNSALTGGGIFNFGSVSHGATLTLIGSLVSSNSSGGGGGGGICADGSQSSATTTIIGTVISGNTATGAVGGGIRNKATPSGTAVAYITNSTISSNFATGEGGGIQNDGLQAHATLFAVKSTVSGNTAQSRGGGFFNNDGGSGGTSAVTLINTTVSGNSSSSSGGAIRNGGSGGGTTTFTLISSTVSSNSTSSGADVSSIATLSIGNTILNAESVGSNISSSVGTVTSLGFNLCSDGGGGFLTNATDQLNLDPKVGPLQDNGGPTFTHALLSGSPATDSGKNLSGDTTDQRGFPRTYDNPSVANVAGGDGTDIGSFEAFALQITAANKIGDDLRLSFTSLPGVNYEVQNRGSLLTGVWGPSPGFSPGNGGIAQATVTNAFAQPEQFYQIHQLP